MKFINYLDRVLKSHTKESSKRLLAFIGVITMVGLSFAYTRPSNLVLVLGVWAGLVSAALYITMQEKK